MNSRARNVGLIVLPLRNPEVESGQYFIDQILECVSPAVDHVVVMTGNYRSRVTSGKVEIVNVKAPIVRSRNESSWSKAWRMCLAQFRLTAAVIAQRKKFQILVLYLFAPYLAFPAALCKLMGKRIVLVPTGSDSQSIGSQYSGVKGKAYRATVRALELLVYSLSDYIVVVSDAMIKALGLESVRRKVITGVGKSKLGGSVGYVATDVFRAKRPWRDRGDVVGYLGRLSGEKGILQFVAAIPLILKNRPSTRFLIVGDGDLMPEAQSRLRESNCLNAVEFAGLVPHDQVPEFLNRMKFLVVPSYSEVFAGAALEAMSCGTICLTTKVGAAEDILVDGQNGFLLKDNDPSTISGRLLQVWQDPRLEDVEIRARSWIESNFTKPRLIDRWIMVFDRVAG